MLAEFVKSIVELTKAETRFESFNANDESQLVRLPDGTVREFAAVPGKRRLRTVCLESFCDLLNAEEGTPLVCVTPYHVRGYFDPNWRDEWVDLTLTRSSAFVCLLDFAHPKAQREAVALVRDGLYDCIDPGLLPALRRLDFSRRSDGSRNIPSAS